MYELGATADALFMTAQGTSAPELRPVEQATPDSFACARAQGPATDTREPSLVSAVLAGDRDAFGRLYQLYAPLVHGILLARLPRSEVEDLVQDIFLHAFRKLHTLRDARAFGSWIAMKIGR